jgi:hypothetical protein
MDFDTKDKRTARELIEDPNTNEDLRTLIKLAVKKDGFGITPTQDSTWEKSMTTEKNMLLFWYGVPSKDHSGHMVGIDKITKKSLEKK